MTTPPGLAATLTLDRVRCAPNETVAAELRVVNGGAEPAVAGFGSGLRCDFVVEPAGGSGGGGGGPALWRWSDGRAFIQMLGEETLAPGGGALVYRARVPAPAAPGRYRVTGTLASYDHPLAASAELTVTP